jgi:quinol monooxygenase YgiN
VIVLHIEHAISDFTTWKQAFDSDPIRREQSGVRSYQVFRPTDDPNYVMIDLEFDSSRQAESFRASLEGLWRSGQAGPALRGTPRARILETVERREY